MDINADIFPTAQLGLPTFRNVTHCMVCSHRKKRRRLNLAAGPAAFFFSAFKKYDRDGGGSSSLSATVLWGASLPLTSSHLHVLGEYRPHAIRELTCRLTCADLSSRAFSNYPL